MALSSCRSDDEKGFGCHCAVLIELFKSVVGRVDVEDVMGD